MESYQLLEKELSAWSGYPRVVACSSGTAALHLALESLRLPPGASVAPATQAGAEVILPDYTMIACARAVTLAGLTPVFVDCGPDLLMRADLVRRAVTDRTKAIMAVHVYGRLSDMDGICTVAKDYERSSRGASWRGLPVIEDCAESHGATHPHLTYAKCWSFYRNKIIAGEEGGAVAFLSERSADHARCLRSLGFTAAHDFLHVPRGHNYRLANCLAEKVRRSLALYQSPDVTLTDGRRGKTIPEYRREIEGWYNAACPPEWRMLTRDAVWVYDVRIPGLTRESQGRAVRALNAAGVAARHGFRPMSEQEEYRGCRIVGDGYARTVAPSVLYFPVEPGTTTPDSVRKAFSVLKESLV